MKEAIGGTWLFGIVLTFIVFFTTYVSVSTNYAKAFKVKDELLLTIEHFKGVNDKTTNRINEYLKGVGYYSEGKCIDNSNESSTFAKGYSKWEGFYVNGSTNKSKGNYCIRRYVVSDGKTGPIGHPSSAYYQVLVFFKLDWPIIRTFFEVRIDGETSIIYHNNDKSSYFKN